MPRDETLIATTPEEMLNILQREAYDTALSLHELGKNLGCKFEAKTGAQSYKIVYSVAAPKKRALFSIECNAKKWRVKANLFRIAAYQDAAQESALMLSVTASRRPAPA